MNYSIWTSKENNSINRGYKLLVFCRSRIEKVLFNRKIFSVQLLPDVDRVSDQLKQFKVAYCKVQND